MSAAVEQLQQQILNYVRSFGKSPGRLFTLREFNSQVMMHRFSAEDRVLDEALAGLVETGVLVKHSPTEYMLA